MNYLLTGVYFILIIPIIIYFFQKYKKQMTEDMYNKKLATLLIILTFLGFYIFKKTEVITLNKFLAILRYTLLFLGILALLHTKYNENKDNIDKLIEKYYLITIIPMLIGMTLIKLIIN